MVSNRRQIGRIRGSLYSASLLILALCRSSAFVLNDNYARHQLSGIVHESHRFSRRDGAKLAQERKSFNTSLELGMWSQDEDLQGADRFRACVPYLLPLLDGDHFGVYIYDRVPPLAFLHGLFIEPLANIFYQIPFLGVGLFIALTLGTRFNTDMDRNVRFSAQQAALLDLALLFPELISSSFEENPVPRYIMEPCSNFVWYAYMSAVCYSIFCNLRGKKPDQIPYISGSADTLVGPF